MVLDVYLTLPLSVIGEIFRPPERVKYMGILGSVFGVADVLGPILGGVITDTWGWRWVFFVNVRIGIMAVTIILYSLPNFKLPDVKKVIDYGGIVTFTLALSALILALTLAGEGRLFMEPDSGTILLSGVSCTLFVLAGRTAVERIVIRQLT